MRKRFEKQVVLVTGGGHGIGLAVAARFSQEGALVVLNDLDPERAEDAASEAKVVATLHALAAGGVTLVVATHKSALLPIVERLLVIQGGRVAIDGPRDLVLAKLSGSQPVSPAAAQQGGLKTASA